jgi:hypothetical protein
MFGYRNQSDITEQLQQLQNYPSPDFLCQIKKFLLFKTLWFGYSVFVTEHNADTNRLREKPEDASFDDCYP